MINTKTILATRLLVRLAQAPQGQTIAIKDLAEAEDLSGKYLEVILPVLREAGIVASVKGKGGGYTLAKPAWKISLWDIHSCFERSVLWGDNPGEEHGVDRVAWARIELEVVDRLRGTDLERVVLEYRAHQGVLDYQI